jgi:hypothetical protein
MSGVADSVHSLCENCCFKGGKAPCPSQTAFPPVMLHHRGKEAHTVQIVGGGSANVGMAASTTPDEIS